jgi:hypothetical protein
LARICKSRSCSARRRSGMSCNRIS